MNRLKILPLIVLPSFSVFAAESQLVCTPGLSVYYGNGMLSQLSDRSSARAVLTQALESEVAGTSLEDIIDYYNAHNPTQGGLLDFFEAVEQKLNIEESKIWAYLVGAEVMPEAVAEVFRDISAALVTSSAPAVVREHVGIYNAELQEGQKVIVVSHSQGNLFALQAASELNSEYSSAWGMVAVANPASYVAAGGMHTTLYEDIVMEYIPGSMPANVPNFPNTPRDSLVDWTGHRFVLSYMASGTPSKSKIVNDVLTTEGNLSVNEEVLGTGAFTATLTWGSEPDVDLHVFEPSGAHIYYRNFQGAGYLDVDDTTSYGPEHYYLPCDNIEAGTYRIGANYYEGEGSETARIVLKTEEETLTRTQSFSSAIGSDGDASPSILFEVTIEGNEEDGYKYTVD
ncbi:YfaP family protein [Vibrio sp. PNB22_2_2]|uniref:YfaP family protein n=1 Tax=unclassified Vibrio TaxID=2614977 RepID=UPI00406A0E26